eukprot:6158332-Pyramimonas_sp.AAC.1
MGANHRQGEGIYRERDPITDRERGYTRSGNQSQAGRVSLTAISSPQGALGLTAVVKPLLRHSTTGELDSPLNYSARAPPSGGQGNT